MIVYTHEDCLKKFFFSSTGSIYGETDCIPTPENSSFPVQTSLYGASKLACEGLITAYSHGYGIKSYIFRFVSILGERYTHGHVFDFTRGATHYHADYVNPKWNRHDEVERIVQIDNHIFYRWEPHQKGGPVD